MKDKRKILFTVTEANSGALIKVRAGEVIGSNKRTNRVILSDNPDDALLLCHPYLQNKSFRKKKFILWAVEIKSYHRIYEPKKVKLNYGHPFAVELNEWCSVRNIRMVKATDFTLSSETPTEEITAIIDGVEKVIAQKYLLGLI